MSDEDPTKLPAYLTAFPEAVDVFAGDVAAHRRVLQPFVSIDASVIDPAWSGRLHFVSPLEPDDGLVGDGTEAFHSGYCVTNWIAFRVADSRYAFLGDFRYFKINGDLKDADRDYYEKDYAAKEQSFAETVAAFRETGELHPPGNRKAAVGWIDEVGGDSAEGNWSSFGLPLDLDENGAVHPLTTDGRRFRYVGALKGFRYRKNTADSILLFFDPVESVAVLTFDWT